MSQGGSTTDGEAICGTGSALPRSSPLGRETGRETRPERPAEGREQPYDVVVVGGALAGSSSALLLRQHLPEARILVVEASERFGRKVGEATVELSGLFLHRVLGLYDHLSRCHLPKHGLRFWFHERAEATLDEMTEIGPRGLPSAPSFQLDRSVLDQHLLDEARSGGIEVLRPAKVLHVQDGWPLTRVTIEHVGRQATPDVGRQATPDAGRETAPDTSRKTSLATRWVIDASGRHGFLGRRKRLFERIEEHPVAACWGRWRGFRDLDRAEVLGGAQTRRLEPLVASRRLATNHFCGYGYWIWAIPLAGGETSVGVVWNKELFELPDGGTKQERYEAFLRWHPGIRELLAGASLCEGDFLSLAHLPYRTRQYAGRGWALVGDAAGFIDPYYSPGIDHLATSVYATVGLVAAQLGGQLQDDALERLLARHNRTFISSDRRWLDALYAGKYSILGDAELASCSFLLDTAFYYFGVVSPAYRHTAALANGVFGAPERVAAVAARVVRFFNRRLQRHAARRLRMGTYGRRNSGWRLYVAPFRLGRGGLLSIARGLWHWLRIELGALFTLRRALHARAADRSPARRSPAVD